MDNMIFDHNIGVLTNNGNTRMEIPGGLTANAAAKNTVPGIFVPEKTIIFNGADMFEAVWRALTGVSEETFADGGIFYAIDVRDLFCDTEKVMIPKNITAGRLAAIVRLLGLISKMDIRPDIFTLSDIVEYDVFLDDYVPVPTLFFCGKNIFEYCLEEMLSEDNAELDIREIFEDRDNIAIPSYMTDKRLRRIYNELTLYSDEEFAESLSVAQYKTVTPMDLNGIEKEEYIPLSDLESLINECYYV